MYLRWYISSSFRTMSVYLVGISYDQHTHCDWNTSFFPLLWIHQWEVWPPFVFLIHQTILSRTSILCQQLNFSQNVWKHFVNINFKSCHRFSLRLMFYSGRFWPHLNRTSSTCLICHTLVLRDLHRRHVMSFFQPKIYSYYSSLKGRDYGFSLHIVAFHSTIQELC